VAEVLPDPYVPVPTDQVIPDALVKIAFRFTEGLDAHTAVSAPAFTAGWGFIVILLMSVSLQLTPLVTISLTLKVPEVV